jgi:2-oxoisovalerate dehydrogenase E2 component (dihydrolipoyl transacylase)
VARKVGDLVTEDQVMAEVMTEKAAVEVPAPVTGRVLSITGAPGDMVRVGAELIVFDTESAAEADLAPEPPAQAAPAAAPVAPAAPSPPVTAPAAPAEARKHGRVMASPATRRRAREAGLDLAQVAGSGPSGRITRQDIDAALTGAAAPAPATAPAKRPGATGLARRTGTEEIKVIGVRRVIANRMTDAKRNIPHFAQEKGRQRT